MRDAINIHVCEYFEVANVSLETGRTVWLNVALQQNTVAGGTELKSLEFVAAVFVSLMVSDDEFVQRYVEIWLTMHHLPHVCEIAC